MNATLEVVAEANFSSMDLFIADDDCPKAPHPADDSLSSAQSRRYYKEQLPPPSKRSLELLAVGHPKAR